MPRTNHFTDQEFDGDSALITEQEMDETGQVKGEKIYREERQEEFRRSGIGGSPSSPRKFYVDGGQVEIAANPPPA